MTETIDNSITSNFKPGDLVQMRSAHLKLRGFAKMNPGDIGLILSIDKKQKYKRRRVGGYYFSDKYETVWYATVMWREYNKTYSYDGLPQDTVCIEQFRLKKIGRN